MLLRFGIIAWCVRLVLRSNSLAELSSALEFVLSDLTVFHHATESSTDSIFHFSHVKQSSMTVINVVF